MRTTSKRPRGLSKPTYTLVTNEFEVVASLLHVDACGGWSGSFRTAIEVESTDLDEHGFVIEAFTIIEAVRKFFATATYKASCEQLAACVMNLVVALGNGKVKRVQAKVFSATGHIRAEWHEGDVVPDLPHCVV